ncbi:MAG: type III polyketide synthase [Planctomycetota bacterium]|nr:MAG: type III polyketide synthase [Planctomycetota bacterium]
MSPAILGLATAVPPHAVDQDAALELARSICCRNERHDRVASVLYRHSGINTRHSVLPPSEAYRYANAGAQRGVGAPNHGPTTAQRMAYYQEHALPLAARAAGDALARSGVEGREIAHVVTASCTGFTAPGVDSGLIERLGLRRTTQRIHVGFMGCHAAVNALRTARALALADAHGHVLACCVELCSLHYSFHWDNERMLGNALFADGAAAAVVSAMPRKNSGASPGADGQSRWRIAATGSFLFPDTSEAMTWNIGDHGFAMTISSELPRLIAQGVAPWLTGWLKQNGLAPGDVNSWAIHPGGPRIVEAVESAMAIPAAKTEVSREILAEFGNMSSATVLFILQRLTERRAAPPCVMLAFGPGLIAEAVLFR